MTTDQAAKTCPSSTCSPGHQLIGVVGPTGHMGYVSPPLEIDADFVERASRRTDVPPEARFRFAGPCVESRCAQWSEGACSVISRVVEHVDSPTADALPVCGIRSSCRWFSQEGRAACERCPLVTRSTRR
jgi:hypothetical protein